MLLQLFQHFGRSLAAALRGRGRGAPRRRDERERACEPCGALRRFWFLDSRLLRSLLHLHAAAVSVSRRGLLPLGRRKFTYVSRRVSCVGKKTNRRAGGSGKNGVGSIALEDCVTMCSIKHGARGISNIFCRLCLHVDRGAEECGVGCGVSGLCFGVSLSLASGIRHR